MNTIQLSIKKRQQISQIQIRKAKITHILKQTRTQKPSTASPNLPQKIFQLTMQINLNEHSCSLQTLLDFQQILSTENIPDKYFLATNRSFLALLLYFLSQQKDFLVHFQYSLECLERLMCFFGDEEVAFIVQNGAIQYFQRILGNKSCEIWVVCSALNCLENLVGKYNLQVFQQLQQFDILELLNTLIQNVQFQSKITSFLSQFLPNFCQILQLKSYNLTNITEYCLHQLLNSNQKPQNFENLGPILQIILSFIKNLYIITFTDIQLYKALQFLTKPSFHQTTQQASLECIELLCFHNTYNCCQFMSINILQSLKQFKKSIFGVKLAFVNILLNISETYIQDFVSYLLDFEIFQIIKQFICIESRVIQEQSAKFIIAVCLILEEKQVEKAIQNYGLVEIFENILENLSENVGILNDLASIVSVICLEKGSFQLKQLKGQIDQAVGSLIYV